jgi:hypothetical protein
MEPRPAHGPACTGADDSTDGKARRINACCRIDARRRVLYGLLQVTEEIQSSKDVAGGVCRCRQCEQQLVPTFVISLSRKMDSYMVYGGAVLNTQMHTTRVQHTLEAWMIIIIRQPLYGSSLSSS